MEDDNLKILLYKLPPFIQKGNKFCKLIIHKQCGVWVIKYTNATNELHDFDHDLSAVAERILKKLSDLKGSKGYNIEEQAFPNCLMVSD